MICSQCGHENPETNKFCGECAAPLAARPQPAREVRKTVTAVFCDVVGSTPLGERLDPEVLRRVMGRYFDEMRAAVEGHGGRVDKFVGDAVVAVFGVPQLHEDDALRAVRAASEMHTRLGELNGSLLAQWGVELEARTGVSTGEVVVGEDDAVLLGDVMNTSARLEQAAEPGEVLIGASTLALVEDAVDVQPVAALELKGKADPVPAYRLVAVGGAPERRHDERFIGRASELALFGRAWERVREGPRCELVSVIGDAGVGKSRLVAEALGQVDATVVRGRCLPYGEGITYWPVVEVLKQLGVLPADESAAAAIRSLLDETEVPTSVEEIAWGFRRTLEQAASERPVVVVFDDIQWGEQAFLDLIEHVALLSSGAPILLVCIARPELAERRPDWPVLLRLEPLSENEVDELIADRIPVELRGRIARAAGGNPLFVEEMLAMAGQAGGEVVVPPTLRALLQVRLDQLESAERGVLERGAIEGEVFHRGAVQTLAPEETEVTPRLAALVRKGLIRPDRPQLVGEDGFRFRHLLIRDAAYDALSKATRAELHQRFVGWLETHGADLVELDEILGYHLEQACRYRTELGLPRDESLVAAAQRRLVAAGRRAYRRADHHAGAHLLERAATLTPPGAVNLELETQLVDALYQAGRVQDAAARAASIAERASALGDQVGELSGRLQAGIVAISLEPEGAAERLAGIVDEALTVFQAADDDLGLATAYSALAQTEFERAHVDAALDAYERAAIHARQAGLQQEFLDWRALCRFYGTTPASGVLEWLDEHEPRTGWHHWGLRACRAHARGMMGHLDEARAILAEARVELAARGGGIGLAVTTAIESASLERLAGEFAAAAELGAEGCRLLEQMGEQSFLSTAAAELAAALYALDRLAEADAWVDRAAAIGASEDAFTQIFWRQVKAKLLARAGDHDEAERLAAKAVAISRDTDFLNGQADATADLADVLLLGGKTDDAAAALEQALRLYERKGNLVSARRVRARLVALGASAEAPAGPD